MDMQIAITINGRPQVCALGSTISSLLIDFKYAYAKIYVKVNGAHIDEATYNDIEIHEGDCVQVIHLMAGG